MAAIRAAQLGLSTALVERAELGGICLNWGCIPTKALLHSAMLRACREAAHYGVTGADAARPDLPAMVTRSRKVAGRLGQGVAHLMKKNGVTVIQASARLAGAGRLALDNGGTLSARHIILATGARARELPALPLGERIWAYRQALVPDAVPKSLLVVGAGAIGAEFASFYRAVGADVTLIDMTAEILPQEDAEISQLARKAFEKQGIRVLTQCAVTASSPTATGVKVTLEQQGKRSELEVERVIVAAGIVGNVENLGLEGTRVKVEKSHIVTDGLCRTGEPGVYAIGDVAGAPWLAHKASHEGVLCVEAIAGKPAHAIDPLRIPACTYSHPQVASIGMTEARARACRQAWRRDPRGQVHLRRQRQGHRHGRGPGPGQDRVRCPLRRAAGRAHHPPRSLGADHRLRRGNRAGSHRGRPDAHRVRASDAVGNAARIGAGGLRAGATRLNAAAR